MVCITKPLEVDDLALAQEADHVIDIRIIGQAENIVIGKAGLLLCCDLLRTTFSSRAKEKN